MQVNTVFISAVSSEFAAVRRELAGSLRRAGKTVIFHDELHYGQTTLLRDLQAEVQRSGAAVFIVGQRSGGGFPTDAEAVPFAALLPAGEARASYTQWEFLLARDLGMPLLAYEPAPSFVHDPPPDPAHADDDPALQTRFVGWLRGTGVTLTPFASIDRLCRAVLE